jgi:hypothetical protein
MDIVVGKGDVVALLGMVEVPAEFWEVSSLVMVRFDGILPEPLCFLLFVVGPLGPDGDAGLDRFRGVKVADVFVETPEAIAKGVLVAVIGKFGLKLCCNPFKSVVENDCLKILLFPIWLFGYSRPEL